MLRFIQGGPIGTENPHLLVTLGPLYRRPDRRCRSQPGLRSTTGSRGRRDHRRGGMRRFEPLRGGNHQGPKKLSKFGNFLFVVLVQLIHGQMWAKIRLPNGYDSDLNYTVCDQLFVTN